MQKGLQTLFKKRADKETFSFLQDLVNHTEAVWDYGSIRYKTVMTGKEWRTFSKHPERKPYKSKYLTGDKEKDYALVSEALRQAHKYYLTLKPSERRDEYKAMIATLTETFINSYYSTLLMRLNDMQVGRDDRERDNGTVEPTDSRKQQFDYAIYEYSKFAYLDHKKLKNQIYAICGGVPSVLAEYLYTCDVPLKTRKIYSEIIKIYAGRDANSLFANVKVAWEVWKTVRCIGLDQEAYLELHGFVDSAHVEKKLFAFARNKEYIADTLSHMKDDLPAGYKKYKAQGYVNHEELLAEEAKRKKYPKKLRTEAQLARMISQVEREVHSLLPLSKLNSPRDILFNPTHPAAGTRAFQSTTKNTKSKRVNAIFMTPRVLSKDDYRRVFAHESAHALHRVMLNLGEESKTLHKGAMELVPGGVMEEFSQLVDQQFQGDALPYKKRYKGKHFPSFRSAYGMRLQVPFSFTQIAIRRLFDKWWDSGRKDPPTEEELWNMKRALDTKFKKWSRIGVNIRLSRVHSFRYLSAARPTDHMVYMKRYIVDGGAKKTSKKPNKTLSDHFRKRFGDSWIKTKEGRIMLHWLMLESGRNHKSEKYGALVERKNLNECRSELEKVGVNLSKI